MGGVDVTSVATVPADQRSVGHVRRPAATASSPGWPSPPRRSTPCAATPRPTSSTSSPTATGSRPATTWRRVTAPTRSLLTAERTALNLLCHLSGVATLTRRWADALDGHGLRRARHPQDDARAAGAGEVRRALRRRRQPPHGPVRRRARQGQPRRSPPAAWPRPSPPCGRWRRSIPVEIEVDSLDGLREAIDAGADVVLLDNFDARRACAPPSRIRDELGPAVRARGERRADARGRPPGRRDRRRLRRRRRAHPLGQGPRPRPRPRHVDADQARLDRRICRRRAA